MGGRTSRPRRRPGLLARLYTAVVLIIGLPMSLIALDSMTTTALRPERSTTVDEVSTGFPDAPTYDARFATVFLNGLGRDISRDQAEALTPSVGQFGRVYALEYASVFDAVEATDVLAAALRAEAHADVPTYLTVVASSMGDVRGLEIIASLEERYAASIQVLGFVVNTGPGPGKRVRVRGGPSVQALLDQSCTPFVPGQITLGLVEILNQGLQGHVGGLSGAAVAYRAGTAYPGRVVVNQLCSLTRDTALVSPPFIPFSVYLTTGYPLDDVIVDGDGAYADWLEVLPGMQLRRVEGATHDNFSYRPDLFNPLFAHDLMPLIRNQQIARGGHVRSGGSGISRPA